MAKYKIYGTNQPYGGKVVNINGDMFTTIGGTLEGDSKHVVVDGPAIVGTVANNNGGMNMTAPAANSNPVTRTFVSRMVYYRAVSGTGVPIGTSLHEHQDGTIMVGNHNNPNYDMNAPNNVVTATNPNPPIGSGTGGSRNNRMRGGRNTTPRRTMGNRNNGGSSY